MAYTTTVVAQFDEQLFSQCFTDYYNVLLDSYVEKPTTVEISILRDMVQAMWVDLATNPASVQYKITDTETDQDVGYCLGLIRREHRLDSGGTLKIMDALYRNDQSGSRDWVTNYIQTTLCDQEMSVATQLNTVRWQERTKSETWESYLLGLGLKRMRVLNHSGGSSVRSLSNSESFISRRSVFLSPWGWPEWKYEQ
jgi:hypothetical protein